MIYFELVTLSGVKLREKVYEVMLPTPQGQIAVFKNHAPLVSVASAGEIKVREQSNYPDDMLKVYAVSGGVIEIADDTVRVLVDEAESSEEIDASEAERAYKRAQEMMQNARDKVSIEKAEQQLNQSSARLRVAGLKRKKRR